MRYAKPHCFKNLTQARPAHLEKGKLFWCKRNQESESHTSHL